jgi:7-cyano-7-deazaguanine synthase
MTKTVALLSGGLDSVTLAHYLAHHGHRPLVLVSVDYGQRHRKELEYAKRAAIRVDADQHVVLPMPWLAGKLGGSALTSERAVPHGHYAAETMAQTVVANRNMILIALAAGIAVAAGANRVALAVHSGDHAIYPDCRPEFIDAMNRALVLGTEGHAVKDFALVAPFIYSTKAIIAKTAADLKVPIAETWSCYEGGEIQCGRCGTCVERQEAFAEAGVADPTVYADPDYWREAVAAHRAGAAS